MTKLTNQDNIARAFKVRSSIPSSHLAHRAMWFTKIMLEQVLDSWVTLLVCAWSTWYRHMPETKLASLTQRVYTT